MDIALLAPGSATWSYTDTPSLLPSGTVSMRYVALHELGHAIGLVHDEKWPNALKFEKVNNVMDARQFSGGDFGGPVPGAAGGGLQGILRVTGAELWALNAAMTESSSPGSVLDPSFGNLALRRFVPEHDDDLQLSFNTLDKSVELWATSHYGQHDSNWTLGPCGGFGWPMQPAIESPPKGFHPVQVAALTAGGNGGAGKIEWFLTLPGETCGAVPDRKIGEQYANPDPASGAAHALDAGMAYWAGHHDPASESVLFKIPQQSEVAVNTDYHICAIISAVGVTTRNDHADDDAIYSEAMLTVKAPSPGDYICGDCDNAECPSGTSCQPYELVPPPNQFFVNKCMLSP